MTAVLDELELTELVTSITGMSAVGAAAILAETGDPSRFATARALVKHAGLAPREKLSGAFTGRTRLTGAGTTRAATGSLARGLGSPARQPRLRRPLPAPDQREHNKLTPTQAQTVIAAAILRQLHAVITTGRAWDPDIATHGTQHTTQAPSPPDRHGGAQADGRGEPYAALRHPGDLAGHHGQPRPSSHQPDYTLLGPTPLPLCRDRRRSEAPTKPLTQNDLR